jgi:hypothetical protein
MRLPITLAVLASLSSPIAALYTADVLFINLLHEEMVSAHSIHNVMLGKRTARLLTLCKINNTTGLRRMLHEPHGDDSNDANVDTGTASDPLVHQHYHVRRRRRRVLLVVLQKLVQVRSARSTQACEVVPIHRLEARGRPRTREHLLGVRDAWSLRCVCKKERDTPQAQVRAERAEARERKLLTNLQ